MGIGAEMLERGRNGEATAKYLQFPSVGRVWKLQGLASVVGAPGVLDHLQQRRSQGAPEVVRHRSDHQLDCFAEHFKAKHMTFVNTSSTCMVQF